MKLTNLLVLAVTVFSTACATFPPMSPMQRRAMQTRTFEDASYETVFRSFKTVLQDDGYIIKNQDLNGGLIVATREKTDPYSGFALISGTGHGNYKTDDGVELSINLEKLNEKTIETRLTIQQTAQYSHGGRTAEELLDEKMYKALYDRVRVEVERRKAQGKA